MASVYKHGKNYSYSFVDHRGKRVSRSAKTTDKSVAKRIAAKAEADSALRRDMVIDPAIDNINRESKRSIDDHLADYKAKYQAGGRSEKHIKSTIVFIQRISEFAGFQNVSDITPEGVTRYVSSLRDIWESEPYNSCSPNSNQRFHKMVDRG